MNSENATPDVLEQSPIGLMQVDELGKILKLNTLCADIFGYEVYELLGQSFSILLPVEIRSKNGEFFNRFVQSDESRVVGQGAGVQHFPALHKAGHEIAVQLGITILRYENAITLTLAIVDVSEQARVLSELRMGNERLRHKTRELMQVVRQQNYFLNVVSHELRTPLNNSLEMLNQLSATQLNEDQAELFQDLDKANIDVTRSVKMLMDYADSMLGELQLEEEEFDLRALWLDRLRLVQRAHPGQIHLLKIREKFDFDPLVLGDKIRLGRMMHGLIDNALKFSDASQIQVQITFDAQQGSQLRFEVQDNGVGMEESLVTTIGKPFANQSQRRSRGGGGMGVGFYLTHKYLELMKGQFKLQSELGQGTQAIIHLPLQVVGKAIGQCLTSNSNQGELPLSNLKLLLVEDDATVAKINAIRLRKLGAQVIVAGNGQLAVEMLQDKSVGVAAILMDLHMPVMDGFSATRHIRDMKEHIKTPIVAVTAGSRLAEYTRAMAAGIDAFYSKPFEPNVLVQYFKSRGLIH
ncbi:hybrid sensor histidine kinase/response regulator [Limnobacter parvus]|uniref:histidine kinase n=1 Tax=Limnobacter parvus TaxID=2939690 RepID=A0ABT1XF66_9BURK|nr:ATP-binding protein [Limnobacter parvus]MCR2745524.1 ATP-binding protein [Limnobacter parvus]